MYKSEELDLEVKILKKELANKKNNCYIND